MPHTKMVMRLLPLRFGLAAIVTAVPSHLRGQEPTLIPRSTLFGYSDRTWPQISPDGTRLAYLAADSGVLNVWVRSVGKNDDRAVTHDSRPIRNYWWQGDSRHILHLQDRDGDEQWRLYQTDFRTGLTRDLTPGDNLQTTIIATERGFPNTILVGWNQRDRRLRDVYRLDLTSGRSDVVEWNPGSVSQWYADNALRVRVAGIVFGDGSREYRVRDGPGGPWRMLLREAAEESSGRVVGFTPDNRSAWILSSLDANALRLLQVDLASGDATPVVSDTQFDISQTLIHPIKNALQAVRVTRQRAEWKVIDQSLRADFAALSQVHTGDLEILSRDNTDTRWVVVYGVSDGPFAFYLYDRVTRKAHFLFHHKPELDQYQLAKMEPISFRARDGLQLFGYLTLPVGRQPQALPLVLMVHGGPWIRDKWGFQPEVQWLANRGYAVLQINFRGSAGFGKKYLNAGDREWGGKMHTDLLDGKAWAVSQGFANPSRVAIYGWSYGGYAALVGAAFTPDEFACGVDVAGPSNLITAEQHMSSRTGAFARRMGTDVEFLKSRSPLFKADQIKAPLLIVQGANDPRVKRTESDQIVAEMRKNHKEVRYIVFTDEGHEIVRQGNRLKFYAAAEAFLARCLGGRAEPIGEGEKFSELEATAP